MRARTHSLRAGATLPGAGIRILLPLVAAGASFALLAPTGFRFAPIVLAVVGALFPRSLCAWAAGGAIVLGVLLTDPEPWRSALAVLAVHLVHLLGSLGMAIPPTARVQLRALLPTAIRLLWIQAISQAVLLGTVMLVPRMGPVGLAWLAPVGAAGLLAAALLLARLGETGARGR